MAVKNIINNSLFNLCLMFISRVTLLLIILQISSVLDTVAFASFSKMYSIHQFFAGCIAAGFYELAVFKIGKVSSKYKYIQNLYSGISISAALDGFKVLFIFLIILFFFNHKFGLSLSEILLPSFSGFFIALIILESKLLRLLNYQISASFLQHLTIISGFTIAYFYFIYQENVSEFFLLLSIINLLAIGFLYILLRQHIPIKISWGLKTHKKNVHFSRSYFFNSLFGWLVGYGNIFIIAFFLNDAEVAKYTFLYTVGSGILMISSSSNQVWSPYYYNMYRVNKKLDQPRHNIKQYSFIYFASLSISMAIIGFLLILLLPILLNALSIPPDKYGSNNFELLLIIISYIVYVPVWHSRNILILQGKGRLIFKLTIMSSIVGISGIISSIIFLGEIGIYIGLVWMAVSQLLTFIYSGNIHKHLNGVHFSPILGIVILTILFICYL